jgi:hypothetical protein
MIRHPAITGRPHCGTDAVRTKCTEDGSHRADDRGLHCGIRLLLESEERVVGHPPI